MDFRFDERVAILEKWLSGGRPAPPELRMWMTARCNLSCVFCPHGSTNIPDKPHEELTAKEWCAAIDTLGGQGCQHVDISGGEPFLRSDDTLTVMECIKSHGMVGSVTTNATLLREPHVRRIVEMGWESVQISLDGARAETHDMLRGSPGCFRKVIPILEAFRDIRHEVGASQTEIDLTTVLTNRNYREIPGLVRLAVEMGCKSFRLTPMVEQFPECAAYQVGEKHERELMGILDEAISLADSARLSTTIGEVKENLRLALSKDKFDRVKCTARSGDSDEFDRSQQRMPVVCFEPWFVLRIDPLGWINCCTSDTERRVNLRDAGSADLWYNEHIENIRHNMLKGVPIQACKICCYPVYAENIRFAKRLEASHPALVERFSRGMRRKRRDVL